MKTFTQHAPQFSGAPQREVAISDQRSARALEQLQASLVREFKSLWHNPKATPAEQLAIRGNKAGEAFDIHAAGVALVLGAGVKMDPADYTPPLAFTRKADGTVTIDPPVDGLPT